MFVFNFVLKFKVMNFLPIFIGRKANETKGLKLSKSTWQEVLS